MDFAPIVTDRMVFKYTSVGVQHGAMLRAARGSSVPTAAAALRAAIAAVTFSLQSLLPTDFAFTAASYGVADDPTMFPGFTLPTDPTGAIDPATYTHVMKATETTFKGTGGGSKVSLSIFGVFWDPADVGGAADNGRVESGESTPVANAIAALNGAGGLVSIANATITWYPFATVKVNDYWLRRARQGAI